MSKKILANDGIDAVGKELLEKAGFNVVTDKVAQENLAKEIKWFALLASHSYCQ